MEELIHHWATPVLRWTNPTEIGNSTLIKPWGGSGSAEWWTSLFLQKIKYSLPMCGPCFSWVLHSSHGQNNRCLGGDVIPHQDTAGPGCLNPRDFTKYWQMGNKVHPRRIYELGSSGNFGYTKLFGWGLEVTHYFFSSSKPYMFFLPALLK